MIKRNLFCFLFLFLFPIVVVNAEGACDYNAKANLKQEAARVKANYDFSVEQTPNKCPTDEPGCDAGTTDLSFMDIHVLNISENLDVKISGSTEGDTYNVLGGQVVEQSFTFRNANLGYLQKYKFDVYASSLTACPGELLYSFYLKTPRFNEFAYSDICKGSDSDYCKEFVEYDDFTFEQLTEKLKGKGSSSESSEREISKKINGKLLVSVVILISIAGAGAWFYINKKRSKI